MQNMVLMDMTISVSNGKYEKLLKNAETPYRMKSSSLGKRHTLPCNAMIQFGHFKAKEIDVLERTTIEAT